MLSSTAYAPEAGAFISKSSMTRKITKVIIPINYRMIVAVRFMNRRPATRKTTKVLFLIIIT